MALLHCRIVPFTMADVKAKLCAIRGCISSRFSEVLESASTFSGSGFISSGFERSERFRELIVPEVTVGEMLIQMSPPPCVLRKSLSKSR